MTSQSQPHLWRYIGPGPGQNEIHVVLSASPTEIITWGLDGFSWLGSPMQFALDFVLVK